MKIDFVKIFAFGVRRSAFGVRRSGGENLFKDYNYNLFLCIFVLMNDFTEFDAFQRCREFARGVGEQLNLGTFSKDPFLAAALRKTLLSIYSNFGEGFERDGNREFAQFVSIAKGSTGEARAQLMYALDFGYLKPETFSGLDELGRKAGECLGGLIRYLNKTSYRGRKFRRRNELQTKASPRKRQSELADNS